MGLRCSTLAVLVSTCCIDARAGGTIPGALGGHLVIRPTARGALLAAVDGPGDDGFRRCVQQMSLTPLWLEVVRDTGGIDVDGGCCLSSLVSGAG